MSAQATTTAEETAVLDALAGIIPGCMAGNRPEVEERLPPCELPADWAIKTHAPSSAFTCPYQLLLCDEHLRFWEKNFAKQWEFYRNFGLTVCCAKCGTPSYTAEALTWGHERIRR